VAVAEKESLEVNKKVEVPFSLLLVVIMKEGPTLSPKSVL
jgi:hypothetical protein